MEDKELWEQEYERLFGEGFGALALRHTAKTSFKAGWHAAFAYVIDLLENKNG